MTTCIVTIVAFHEHHMFNGFKHMVIPILGVPANFTVLLFYLVGPFNIAGMSWHESYIAFGVALVWGRLGGHIPYDARQEEEEADLRVGGRRHRIAGHASPKGAVKFEFSLGLPIAP